MNVKEHDDILAKVEMAKKQLAELRKQQSELEREKTELEELKGKQEDWIRGKKEVGEALLKAGTILEREEGEINRMGELIKNTRETLSQILDELRLVKEERWKPSTLKDDLTKALLVVQRGRKELSKARGRIPALDERQFQEMVSLQDQPVDPVRTLAVLSSRELIRIGFWIALPVVLMAIVLIVLFSIS
jgi:chromosome segregation ATPase